jgi:hypothetical protein
VSTSFRRASAYSNPISRCAVCAASATAEGARRLQFGIKGNIGSLGARNITPVVAEGDDWKGARTQMRTDRNGKESTYVLPQIGASPIAFNREFVPGDIGVCQDLS